MIRLLIVVTIVGLLIYAWGALMAAAFRRDYGGSMRRYMTDTNRRIKHGDMTVEDIRPDLERRAEMKNYEDAFADLDATMASGYRRNRGAK